MWRELGITLWSPLASNPLNLSTEPRVNKLETPTSFIKQPVVLLAGFGNDAAGLLNQDALVEAGVDRLWSDVTRVHFTKTLQIQVGLKGIDDYERGYELLDRLIELDPELVLLFGQHELITELLSEGMDVVVLPSLEDLRDSPAAKQRCYSALVALKLLA
ncbi:hypothetical protein SAMN03092900_1894 [Thiomicrospira sp. ALE5]|nr:hypothetical protein SAMN03092900_1894 [Thiomicrospira sp. ALE5]